LDAGFPDFPDINHPESTGVSPVPVNNIDGVRMSTALTYINPIRHRLNLTIRANVLVTRILFSGKKVTGVRAESGGEEYVVEGEEVVLSAGAIKSAHLLLLSGIGPAEQLREFDIALVQDLAGVGQNMKDHPQVTLLYRAQDGLPMDPNAPKRECLLHYTATGSNVRNDMLISPSSFATAMGGDPNESIGLSLSASLYKPAGSGEVRLTSADPHRQPELDYRYLEDPWDRQRMREAVRLGIRLLEHEGFRSVTGQRVAPTDADLASDEALDRWITDALQYSATQHMSGTCKMGPASDPMAVVDQHCRVYGVKGLRVVDTSIMPDIVCTGTSGTAMMIGERVAGLMRGQG
jgi:choline dehydrogenase-like flavoprotein